MRNRWGIEVEKGMIVSFHHARGNPVLVSFVKRFSRVSPYGWRVETSTGHSCSIDDIVKATKPQWMRKGARIEVPHCRNGRPGYRWVQGWQVWNPETGFFSTEERFSSALSAVADMKQKHGV